MKIELIALVYLLACLIVACAIPAPLQNRPIDEQIIVQSTAKHGTLVLSHYLHRPWEEWHGAQ